MMAGVAERYAEEPLTAAVWRRNRLLAALPEVEQQRLAEKLRLVDVGLRDLLYEVDQPISFVYFPLGCVISLVAPVGEEAVEVATVGPEGVVGLPAFLGATTSAHRVYCQISGPALRLSVDALARFLSGDGELHRLLHRYTQAMMVFLGQSVACNRLHTVEQRCARWLAHTHDRVDQDRFPLTQEFLAQMLGVRRASVSVSAQILQQAGLIRYSRGWITVLDPDGLRAAACPCYPIIRREFDKL
jgi:CRP-like cAMP-binding protein